MGGKRARAPVGDGLFELLDENLMQTILDKIHGSVDRRAWSLVCKRFLELETRSRKEVTVLRAEVLANVLRRYEEVEKVDLSNCLDVSDGVLETMGRVAGTRLRSISLAKINHFTDAGLASLLSNCPSLRELDLSYCSEITDKGIAAVAHLKELETLHMVNCSNFTDAGLGAVAAGCKALRRLSLRWCLGITDAGISLLASNCKQLEYLDLSYTEVTAEGLESITALESLRDLLLTSCNSVDDACLECLKKCRTSLRVLDVARCQNVSGRGIKALASGRVCLQQLTLSYCLPITDALLASLEKFSCLRVIRLDGCEIAGTELAFIGKGWKSLKTFSVSKCRGVTDDGIRAVVEGCSGLEELDLTCCGDLTDQALASIAKSCKGLLRLKMEACSLVTRRGISLLGTGCKKLETVDFTDGSIDDEGLKSLAKCTALKTLKLGICLNISDKGIGYIAASCSDLIEIDLYRSLGIGDKSVAAIASGCPRLRVLNLSYCELITDASLRSVARLQDLTQLELRSCWLLTSAGLSAVASGCNRLMELDVKRCVGIDDSGLISIAQGCQNLRQVNLSHCQITDVGLLAIAKLGCMRNMKLLHLDHVTPEGLSRALMRSRSLKKVKLMIGLRSRITSEAAQLCETRGCRFRWMAKPVPLVY